MGGGRVKQMKHICFHVLVKISSSSPDFGLKIDPQHSTLKPPIIEVPSVLLVNGIPPRKYRKWRAIKKTPCGVKFSVSESFTLLQVGCHLLKMSFVLDVLVFPCFSYVFSKSILKLVHSHTCVPPYAQQVVCLHCIYTAPMCWLWIVLYWWMYPVLRWPDLTYMVGTGILEAEIWEKKQSWQWLPRSLSTTRHLDWWWTSGAQISQQFLPVGDNNNETNIKEQKWKHNERTNERTNKETNDNSKLQRTINKNETTIKQHQTTIKQQSNNNQHQSNNNKQQESITTIKQ